mgnify:CR=1 FL=1
MNDTSSRSITNGVSASAIYRQNGVTRFWDSRGGDRMVIDNTSGNVGEEGANA